MYFSRAEHHEKMAKILQENQQVVESIEHENGDLKNILKNLLSFQPEERCYFGTNSNTSLNLGCEVDGNNMTFYDTLSDV